MFGAFNKHNDLFKYWSAVYIVLAYGPFEDPWEAVVVDVSDPVPLAFGEPVRFVLTGRFQTNIFRFLVEE